MRKYGEHFWLYDLVENTITAVVMVLFFIAGMLDILTTRRVVKYDHINNAYHYYQKWRWMPLKPGERYE